MTQKITPFLWFDSRAEEAARMYTSVFKNSRITSIRYYGKGGEMKEGSVMSVSFTLDGVEFMALNGGPVFRFTPAISMFVTCDSQAEVDEYWVKLSVGGNVEQCGWLKDKFGISWQIVPKLLGELLADKDPKKVENVTKAMLNMIKLDAVELQRAYDEA